MVHKTNWLKLVVHTSTLLITNWSRMNILPASCMKAGRLVSPPFWFRLKSVNFHLDRLPEQYSCFQRINTQVDWVVFFIYLHLNVETVTYLQTLEPFRQSCSPQDEPYEVRRSSDLCLTLSLYKQNRTWKQTEEKSEMISVKQKIISWFSWTDRRTGEQVIM